MKRLLRGISRIFHPFLFALYPLLVLISNNLQEIRLSETYRSVLYVLLSTIVLFLIFGALLRNWEKAAFVTSVLIFLFFSYGHLYLFVKNKELLGFVVGRHRYLMPIVGSIFILIFVFTARRQEFIHNLTRGLNLTAIVAIAFPLIQIVDFTFRTGSTLVTGSLEIKDQNNQLPIKPSTPVPNIYYIVVDAYTRADILESAFDYDNSAFISFLVDKGFFVADKSLSNYARTALSLSSTMNMDYVTNLEVDIKKAGYPAALRVRISHSFLRATLESLGYSTVSIDSGWQYTQFLDADYYLTPAAESAETRGKTLNINPFEDLLLNVSAGRFVIDTLISVSLLDPEYISDPFVSHSERVLAEFQSLKHAVTLPGPIFVFAHIISPHRPYVFGPNGEVRRPGGIFTFADLTNPTEDEYERRLYLDQLMYITSRLEETIGYILSHSSEPPIIILQSDHGPRIRFNWENPSHKDLVESMANLNALLLPDPCRSLLYPEVSPVNTFRIVFNCAFGTQYELLPDFSYYSKISDTTNFVRVDQQIK